MAEREETPGKFKIRARLSYEHLWKATASVENGPKKYRANFLIDPSTSQGKKDIAQVENAIDEVKEAVWPGKNPKFKDDRYAFLDGDEMVDANGDVRDGYEGMMFVKAANDKRPKLRDRDGQTDLTEEDEKIYSGAHVILYGRFYGIKDQAKGGNGIFCSIDAVQFVKHGEKFGGGGINDDEFEQLPDDEDDDEDRPAKKKRRTIDDDDEDERPAKKRRAADDDDDEDERPKRKPKRSIDDDI